MPFQYLKFDRDVSQIQILVEEGNIDSAFDLYKYGKNVIVNGTLFSLRQMAQHHGLSDDSGDTKRLHKMYERCYANEGGSNFADSLISDVFRNSENYAQYIVSSLIQTIIAPQFAMRAFFQAYDICNDDRVKAEALWDLGVAVLVGSLEGDSVPGNPDENGVSWYDLGKQYCILFQCGGDGDYSNPIYNRKMMDNINFGRDKIRSGNCNEALHNKITAMESLLVTPLLHGALFHTYARATSTSTEGQEAGFSQAFVFGKAILPFLNVASKEDAQVIQESLFNNNPNKPFNLMDAKKIWTAINLSSYSLGVDCSHLGIDFKNMLGDNKATFCDLWDGMTQFPTPPPQPATVITPSPTAFPTPAAYLSMNEIHEPFKNFFTNINESTNM